MFIATRIVKQVLIIYKSLVFTKHIMLLLTYKSGSHMSKGGFIMKLRKLSAAFIASAVLVMPLGSYMTASAEDAPIVFSTFNISGVTEGSAASPTFTPESDIEVFSIMTYHWNHGSGSPSRTGQLYPLRRSRRTHGYGHSARFARPAAARYGLCPIPAVGRHHGSRQSPFMRHSLL